jgi:ribonucleoside-diphosphate reductase alpha chain
MESVGAALQGRLVKGDASVSNTAQSAITAAPEAELRIRRRFTTEGVDPYDEVEWELRDALIQNFRTGEVAFEQRDVEIPKAWSQNATNIVAQKYFRGSLGSPERERSVKRTIDRIVTRYVDEGRAGGYFADDDEAQVFEDELKHLLVTQKAAFNSPVWFNVGWRPKGEEQVSACFILSVEDEMSSILNWYVEEGTIFKHGSGAGLN